MPETKPIKTTSAAAKAKPLEYFYAVGRRKTAIARVRLYTNKDPKGEITVNDKPVAAYFHSNTAVTHYTQPLKLTNTQDRFHISVKVTGSGLDSQLFAVCHGISQALVKVDASFKPVLRQHSLLTRDPRAKQRRMIGTGGKARRQKQSPKR
jgi:small subunit ribosomal protein S9